MAIGPHMTSLNSILPYPSPSSPASPLFPYSRNLAVECWEVAAGIQRLLTTRSTERLLLNDGRN
ncbi:hypothetical protein E2C01_049159 [Portunus trituberculatus]|uniref:Uncharacterized protein n=1 Tax=Portunus trituberculatus TaxID=210409 RepID=A0A5B7GD39_PORTR|nr:hypothetical protein [Portunus trituberculatus]